MKTTEEMIAEVQRRGEAKDVIHESHHMTAWYPSVIIDNEDYRYCLHCMWSQVRNRYDDPQSTSPHLVQPCPNPKNP